MSSICVTSKPTMSQHEQNPRTGTGKLKWNAASANVINYTCASSDMACQNVCYEAYCQGFPLAPCLTAAVVWAAFRAKLKIWKLNVEKWRWCRLHLSGKHWKHCWMKMLPSSITRFYWRDYFTVKSKYLLMWKKKPLNSSIGLSQIRAFSGSSLFKS